MSDLDKKDPGIDNANLHDDRTPDMQQGESKALTGGRRLTKFPLIIIGCVVGLVLFLTALAMMKSGNNEDAQKEEEQAQSNNESALFLSHTVLQRLRRLDKLSLVVRISF